MIYINENHLNDFDWYLRANDDTYIIMENLKEFLADKCSNSMNMYGKILSYPPGSSYENAVKGYIHSGSGWLMSRGSLKLFVDTLNNEPRLCVWKPDRSEDQELANCLGKINIVAAESRDEEYKERFIMDTFEELYSWPSQYHYRHSFNPIRLVSFIFV